MRSRVRTVEIGSHLGLTGQSAGFAVGPRGEKVRWADNAATTQHKCFSFFLFYSSSFFILFYFQIQGFKLDLNFSFELQN
jgi:hypothetical protein